MIPSSVYYEVSQKCRFKTSQDHCSSFGFSFSEKAQLPAIGITEQPMMLTKRKNNRPGYKFSKYFRLKRAVKSRIRSRLRPRI